MLYNLFVLPYLIYCVEIWGNASEFHILPVITLKKFFRSITYSQYLTHNQKYFYLHENFPFQDIGYA